MLQKKWPPAATPTLDLPRYWLLTWAHGDPHRRNRSKNRENRQGRLIKSKKTRTTSGIQSRINEN
jgi:hypothetical protein